MKYIKLTIKAPFMSFGDETSQYQNTRDTTTRPTKSMIVGLIACSMGCQRRDKDISNLSDAISVQSTTINKMANLWQDYQNAHIRDFDSLGHYGSGDDKNVQRWKTYVLNGEYLVFVGSDNDELLKSIYHALSRPFWPLFAGRKCCVFSNSVTEPEFFIYDESDLVNVVNMFNKEKEENVQLCICQ